MGRYGENLVNDNGERLIKTCELYDFKILNGYFPHKDIYKFMWTQPTRKLQSQKIAITDYIITKQMSTIKWSDVQVQRSASFGHYLLKGKVYLVYKHYFKSYGNTNQIQKVEKRRIRCGQDIILKARKIIQLHFVQIAHDRKI